MNNAFEQSTSSSRSKDKGPAGGKSCIRQAIVILGMHRSGTSAMTGILGKLGAALPLDLMAPGIGNEKGHWEPEGIVATNDEILASAESHWEDWNRFNPQWYASEKYPPALEKARRALRTSFDEAPLFLLKDPRICRIIPFWIDVLKEEGVEPLFLLCMREPAHVAASLASRDGMEHGYSLLLWLRYSLEAEAATRGRNRATCMFDQLLGDWVALVARIGEELGISWPRQSADVRPEVDNFITPALTTSSMSSDAVCDIIPWAREAFSIFKRWAELGEDPADYAYLDEILEKFNGASANFFNLLLPGSRSLGAGGGNALRQALEQARHDLSIVVEERERLSSDLNQRLQFALDRQASVTRAFADQENRIAELRAEHLQMEQDRESALTRAAEVETRLCKARTTIAAQENEITSLRQKYARMHSEARVAFAHRAASERSIRDRFQELALLTRLLKKATSEHERYATRSEWMQHAMAALITTPRWWQMVPRPWRERLERQRLRNLGLFDGDAYLARYPDVAAAKMDPFRHYVLHGAGEGRVSGYEGIASK